MCKHSKMTVYIYFIISIVPIPHLLKNFNSAHLSGK